MKWNWVAASLTPGAALRAASKPGSQYAASLLLRGWWTRYRLEADSLGVPQLGTEVQSDSSDLDVQLLEAVAGYLGGSSDGVRLFALAQNVNARRDIRAVAAVVGAMLLSDRRDLGAAVQLLRSVRTGSSSAVHRAWLGLQLALRWLENGEPSRAYAEYEGVLKSRFAASETTMATVIRAVARDGIQQAAWLSRHSEPFRDDLLGDSVSELDAPDLLLTSGSIAQLNEQFAAVFDAPYSRHITFSAEDPVTWPMYAALWRCELLGLWQRSTSVRNAIAKYELMTSVGRADRGIASAFMQLIRSRDDQSVSNALRTYRRAGPLDALSDLGVALSLLPWPPPQRKADLRTIANVGHLIGEQEAVAMLRRLMDLKATTTDIMVSGRTEDVWSAAVAAVVPSVPDAEQSRLSAFIRDLCGSSEDLLLLQSIGAALSRLSWPNLDVTERTAWRSFVENYLAPANSRQFVAAAAATGLMQAGDQEVRALVIGAYTSTHNLWIAALLADMGIPLEPRQWREIGDAAAASVRLTVEESKAGKYSMGIVRTGRLLVLSAEHTHSRQHWEAAVDAILEGTVQGDLKADLLNSMAGAATKVPKWVIRRIITGGISSTRVNPFMDSGQSLAGAWLRFRGQFGGGSESDLAGDLLRLATDRTAEGRMEAASSVPYLRARVSSGTLSLFLLTLTYDQSPDVQTRATYALASLISEAGPPGDRLRHRFAELMSAPGDSIPLAAIRGAEDLADGTRARFLVRQRAMSLAESHPSREVRLAAQRLITQ